MIVDGIPREYWGHWADWQLDDPVTLSVSPEDDNLERYSGISINAEDDNKDAWIQKLPSLRKAIHLVSWRGNNPQSFMDSVLQMHWLKRLCVGRLGAGDLSAFRDLKKLEYLCIHQLHGAKDLSPIGDLPSLEVLEIGFNHYVSDLDWLSGYGLTKLRSLIVYGNKSRFQVSDLRPLARLQALEYLSIPTLDADTSQIESLLGLRHLKFVNLRKKAWPDSVIGALEERGVHVQLGIKPP